MSAIFCESERIPQNTNRIPVFSKSSHRIRRPSEYHARIPRGTAQNTQKNTVFFIVFRIRQRIRYRTCRIRARIRGSHRLLRLRFFVGSSSIKVTVHASVSIGLPSPSRGGGSHLCFCHLCFCLAQLLVDCFSGDASPFAFFLLFPCGLACLLLLLQAVGGRSERKKATHERQGGQHAL